MTTKQATTKRAASRLSVAEYLEKAIDMSGRSQRQLAEDLGYENPNVITMFKQGRTKVPINKINLLARALGLDPANLLRMVMEEYMPEAWAVIDQTIGDRYITPAQQQLGKMIDEITGDQGLNLDEPALNKALRAAFTDAHKRQNSK
ncbi:MAG: helix-turn-helix domain-containing protein [Pseudomonadota bacterium]|nr:helix-turn-helix domain-containing protein [Pseudomonadota bacterium]